jgi:small multidrug resistance pump
MHCWLALITAILFEVAGTTSMKLSAGLTKLVPSILIFLFYGCAVISLTLALKKIDLSVAYAVWSGLGTALIAVIGMVWFREQISVLRLASLGLIILGVTGLNLSMGKQ